MKKQLDLSELFKKSLCSFEIAKKARAEGMTCANTFYAYDPNGDLGDGGWLEKITGTEMYPAINLAFSIGMLDNTDLKSDKIQLSEEDGKYSLHYEDEIYQSENLVDVIVELWINHNNNA